MNDKKCMNKHIKVVYQLSKLVKCNKENQHMEKMYVKRERGRSILSYVGFSKILNVITSFTELKQNIGEEYTKLPLSSSSRDIILKNENLIELES